PAARTRRVLALRDRRSCPPAGESRTHPAGPRPHKAAPARCRTVWAPHGLRSCRKSIPKVIRVVFDISAQPAIKTAATKVLASLVERVTFLNHAGREIPPRGRTGAGRCGSRAVAIDGAADCYDHRVSSECLGRGRQRRNTTRGWRMAMLD